MGIDEMCHNKCHKNPNNDNSNVPTEKSGSEYYTCPMHPEVRKWNHGECTICGMDLEPDVITGNDHENPELKKYKEKFLVGIFLTLPIMFLEMARHINGVNSILSEKNNTYIQFILSIPVVLWSGNPFFIKAYNSLRQKSLNMFSLISLGTGVSFIYSLFALLKPNLFPKSFHYQNGGIPVYFETSSIIITLVLLGQMLELRARKFTSLAIKTLLELTPRSAKIVINGSEQDIPIENIKVGDNIIISPGEKIPADGTITEGSTNVDESMVTGESVPIHKKLNDFVMAGTVNIDGSIIMKATKIGSNTMLANIIKMVNNSQRSKVPIQRVADLASSWFVPVVISVSVFSFLAWSLFATKQSMSYGFISAVNVLIIACPCAIGLATTLSIMVGVGIGAKNGILIKDPECLEVLEKVDTIIIDKTGTLTEGKPKVGEIHSKNDSVSEHRVLQLAASLAHNSKHPLSTAITCFAKDRGMNLLKVTNFESITGKGLIGEIDGQKVALGNKDLMQNMEISSETIISLTNEFPTIVFLANSTSVIGYITLSDNIKKSTLEAIKKLQKMKINIVMATGDNQKSAKLIANITGIKNFVSNVTPEEKLKIVEKYKENGHVVVMIGDGVNDAVALSAAHVGISMGNGIDVAIENSNITLLKGDLIRVVGAIDLSSKVMKNIRQNLFLAFAYNTACIPIAAGVLFPQFGILISPIFAAIAMSASSLSVIGNALRLNFEKI